MQMLKYFMQCYFNQTWYFDELEKMVNDFKRTESEKHFLEFIRELHLIIETKNYQFASKAIEKYGDKILDQDDTEHVILFIYNILLNRPAFLDLKRFYKDCKVVFCPVCCPKPSKAKIVNVIEKATIIANNKQIYVCKPCKLVWFDEENIKANNAQDYKKYMRTLGLKGLWKELTDVDIL